MKKLKKKNYNEIIKIIYNAYNNYKSNYYNSINIDNIFYNKMNKNKFKNNNKK